jgi:hypothetical protein
MIDALADCVNATRDVAQNLERRCFLNARVLPNAHLGEASGELGSASCPDALA